MSEIISADNGKILISAPSGYGKTYFVTALIKQALLRKWRVKILSYTKTVENRYWSELEEQGAEIVYTEKTNQESLLNFLFSLKNGNVIAYIDDIDLYIKDKDTDTLDILSDYFSACRKSNIILIMSLKSIRSFYNKFFELSSMQLIGKFSRYSPSWDSWGIENLKQLMFNLKDHEFIFKYNDEIKIVYIENGIIKAKEPELNLKNIKT